MAFLFSFNDRYHKVVVNGNDVLLVYTMNSVPAHWSRWRPSKTTFDDCWWWCHKKKKHKDYRGLYRDLVKYEVVERTTRSYCDIQLQHRVQSLGREMNHSTSRSDESENDKKQSQNSLLNLNHQTKKTAHTGDHHQSTQDSSSITERSVEG